MRTAAIKPKPKLSTVTITAAPRKKSELTRERILRAAAKVFVEKGYAHARISDVAREAHTHAGAIYYYFASRDELVEEVLTLSTSRLLIAAEAALAKLQPDASYSEKIRTVIRAHLVYALSEDVFTAAYTRMHNQISPEIHARWVESPRSYSRLWRDLLIGGQATGEIRRDLDHTVMRLALLGSVIWTLEWYRPGRMTPDEIADQIATAFFQGNEAKPSR